MLLHHVVFDLSEGLSKPVIVPKGTLQKITEHVAFVQARLGFKIEESPNGSRYWRDRIPTTTITDDQYCETVEEHNRFVRNLYEDLGKYSEAPAENGETLSPEGAQTFWYGLSTLDVPIERWSEQYFRDRMDEAYEVMRGCAELAESTISWGTRKLTPRQAADVIHLFSNYLDKWDIRLEVPNGHDYLASFDDGGYYWCEKCGPVTEGDAANCAKRKCPIRAEWHESE